MAFDLGPLAYGTQGFLQGQQQATQNDIMNQMNRLALGEQQLKYQQDQQNWKNQQALSDDAMHAFSATGGVGQPNPVPQATLPGVQNNQPESTQQDPAGLFDTLGKNAMSRGDYAGASQLWTQAENFRDAQVSRQAKADAMQTGELNRQIKSANFVSQLLGSATDKDDFDQKKFQALGSGLLSPEEAKNINNMQYSPETVDAIRARGMTASQQAQAQLRQMELRQKIQQDSLKNERDERDQARKDAHEEAYETHLTQAKKVGAAAKAPSKADLQAANIATKKAFGDDVEVDEDSDDFIQARSAIASRASQIVQGNKAISYTQAVNQAAEEAKQSGEFGNKTIDPGFFSANKKVGTFSPKGDTQDSAIPLTKGMSAKQLIPGKWYKGPDGRVEQWNPPG